MKPWCRVPDVGKYLILLILGAIAGYYGNVAANAHKTGGIDWWVSVSIIGVCLVVSAMAMRLVESTTEAAEKSGHAEIADLRQKVELSEKSTRRTIERGIDEADAVSEAKIRAANSGNADEFEKWQRASEKLR